MRALAVAGVHVGLGIGVATGLWHFAAPYLHHWFRYMQGSPSELIVAIEWTNFMFSFLLTGVSLLLWRHVRELLDGNRLALSWYGFYAAVWLARVVITVVRPWSGTYDWIFWLQLSIFTLVFVVVVLPYVALRRGHRQEAGPRHRSDALPQ